jgi:hypothetical protein
MVTLAYAKLEGTPQIHPTFVLAPGSTCTIDRLGLSRRYCFSSGKQENQLGVLDKTIFARS